jgi:hypothetical protein
MANVQKVYGTVEEAVAALADRVERRALKRLCEAHRHRADQPRRRATTVVPRVARGTSPPASWLVSEVALDDLLLSLRRD